MVAQHFHNDELLSIAFHSANHQAQSHKTDHIHTFKFSVQTQVTVPHTTQAHDNKFLQKFV